MAAALARTWDEALRVLHTKKIPILDSDGTAQHVLGMACAAPFLADELFDEVRRAWPYRELPRGQFDRVVEFVATGGYALQAYERYARLKKTEDGRWRIANPQVAQQYRLNIGTIVEEPMVRVRLIRGRAPRKGQAERPVGAGGAVEPAFTVQARTSFSPAVKYVRRPSR